MKKEEDNILKRVGTDNYFMVPQNYFESLPERVMDKFPPIKVPSKKIKKNFPVWKKLKPWVYVAAVFIGVAFIVRIVSLQNDLLDNNYGNDILTQIDTENISDEFIDEMLNMSLMDDYSLYVYLTNAIISVEN
ncbi:hypothetical protein EZS27_004305 [termite gut metagenome]|uniref:Uncharacterized protein n=1 Tax=termite gut metagenome TaxID=433724 RepID=A0A5J4SQF4_9ZZZZ